MANKRIQKKRAKIEMLHDKSKVIANLVVLMEPGLTRHEYFRIAKPLFKLDMCALIDLYWHESLRRSPFRRMIPRKTWTGELYNWRPITNMEAK